ncbi:unnamed protein product [marine sediment metagenome]|uniref:Uncharacterized protein n=1 Tax=marine sediment metagenome TaxID=412755 RepID=X0XK12_9ZZZZ
MKHLTLLQLKREYQGLPKEEFAKKIKGDKVFFYRLNLEMHITNARALDEGVAIMYRFKPLDKQDIKSKRRFESVFSTLILDNFVTELARAVQEYKCDMDENKDTGRYHL